MSGRPVFRWFRPSLTPPCRLNWITRRLALLRMSLGKRGQARGEQSTRDGDHADADEYRSKAESINDKADAREQHRGESDERVVHADIHGALGIIRGEIEYVVLRR